MTTRLSVVATGPQYEELAFYDRRCSPGFLANLLRGALIPELLAGMGFRTVSCGAVFRDSFAVDLSTWPSVPPMPVRPH